MSLPGWVQTFEFDSGGPVAFSPYGRWKVRLDREGHLALKHEQYYGEGGKYTDYGSFALPSGGTKLWRLVDAVDIPNLQSSTRMQVPDEGAYTLTLSGQGNQVSRSIWRGDALGNPQIDALIEKLTRVIEEVTGVRPVLR